MAKVSKSDPYRRPVVVAPDRQSAGLVTLALETAGVVPRETVCFPRSWAKSALALFETRPGLLILVPSPKLGTEQFAVVERVIELGGTALAWISGYRDGSPAGRDPWLAGQVVRQYGARVSARLSVVSRAAGLFPLLSQTEWRGISVAGPSSSVKARLLDELNQVGVAADGRTSPVSLVADSTGRVALSVKKKTTAVPPYPEELSEALALLRQGSRFEEIPDDVVEADTRTLSLFLQPPARLLSETGSKKLAGAFGLPLPREQLCRSASEAVRFTRTLGGRAVFKLVKPRLEGKRSLGAVITDVEGPSSGRQAFHTLTGLGESLGPPRALGVLVAEQIAADVHLWLKMEDHRRFGRLVLVGPGDAPESGLATTVFRAPVATRDAYRAVLEARLTGNEATALKVARGIARFSRLVSELAESIDRAEIHPLAAADHLPEAVALDALIAITGKSVVF